MTICAECKHAYDWDEADWECFNSDIVGISPVTGRADAKKCEAMNKGNCPGFGPKPQKADFPWWYPGFLKCPSNPGQ